MDIEAAKVQPMKTEEKAQIPEIEKLLEKGNEANVPEINKNELKRKREQELEPHNNQENKKELKINEKKNQIVLNGLNDIDP